MLTREEQIAKLEETFNQLVVWNHHGIVEDVNEFTHDTEVRIAMQLETVTLALMYLRSIPNPHGVVKFGRPRRRLEMT